MKTLAEKIRAEKISLGGRDYYASDEEMHTNESLENAAEIVENHTCPWRKREGYFEDCIGLGWSDNERNNMKHCPNCMGRIIEETE